LFLGVFAIAGLGFLGFLLWAFSNSVKVYFWKATPCTIVESRNGSETLEPTSKSNGPLVIRYRYEADGETHYSTALDVGMRESLDATKIEKLLFKYPADSNSTCYVNPKNPKEVALRRPPLWPIVFIFLPLIFIGIGVGGIISVWRGKSAVRRVTRSDKMGTVGKLVFFGIFTLVGGIAGYFIAGRPLQTYFAAKHWPETPCEIVSSSVGRHSGSKGGSTYSIDITYRYQVREREFKSDTYSIMMGGSSSGRSSKQRVVARYPVGSKSVCYVNPEDPTETVLNRDLSPWMLLGLIPAIFLLVGITGLVSTVRSSLQGVLKR
jgi:hypothetical protein